MSEPIVTHELFEYDSEEPFHVYNILGNSDVGEKLLHHWHEELEITYCIKGACKHFINGECIID